MEMSKQPPLGPKPLYLEPIQKFNNKQNKNNLTMLN